MARKGLNYEAEVELVEGDLSRLGNALVLLHLVMDRLRAASAIDGHAVLLGPALDDCRMMGRLIRDAQAGIQARARRE